MQPLLTVNKPVQMGDVLYTTKLADGCLYRVVFGGQELVVEMQIHDDWIETALNNRANTTVFRGMAEALVFQT